MQAASLHTATNPPTPTWLAHTRFLQVLAPCARVNINDAILSMYLEVGACHVCLPPNK